MKYKYLFLLILFCYLFSCAKYYSTRIIPNGMNLGYPQYLYLQNKDSIELNLYGNTYFNDKRKGFKKFVHFKNRDIRNLINKTESNNSVSQFLFTYTEIPDYYNIIGFYYSSLSINEIKRKNDQIILFEEKLNGLMSHYLYKKNHIIDCYAKLGGGYIRMMFVLSPNYKNISKFRKEVNRYLQLNSHLWPNEENIFFEEEFNIEK